jgi:hypothetical protein
MIDGYGSDMIDVDGWMDGLPTMVVVWSKRLNEERERRDLSEKIEEVDRRPSVVPGEYL